jgi:hypothetical protein
MQDGKWTRWHANGQKSYEGHWRDDRKHGTTTLWTVHGVKEAQMEFHEGWFVPWSVRGYSAEDGEAIGCGCTSSPAPVRLWPVAGAGSIGLDGWTQALPRYSGPLWGRAQPAEQ